MKKHKNSRPKDNNQLVVMVVGLLIVLALVGSLGSVIEFVVGLVFGVIGLVLGIIGAVIGLVFGLIGVVLGFIGGILGLVFGSAFIWVPLLIVYAGYKAMSSNEVPAKKKKHIIT